MLFRLRLVATTSLLLGLILVASPASSHAQSGEHPVLEIDCVESCNLTEIIPIQYRERYVRWKETFFSVNSGRELWLRYTANPKFHLTISVSKTEGGGASVGGYEWNDGVLVAATITLGSQLGKGYPNDGQYPVLGSLQTLQLPSNANDILAAAKLAHEFGHIDLAANTDATIFQLQNDLSKIYVAHFMSNGHNVNDPTLVELASRMGGAPYVIHTQREYLAETYTLRYLFEKLEDNPRRRLSKLIRRSLRSNSDLHSLHVQRELNNLTSTYAGF